MDIEREVRTARRAQWRGSNDGIVWTSWAPVTSLDMLIPVCAFTQCRIQIGDGEWITSPVEIWDQCDGGAFPAPSGWPIGLKVRT